MPWGLFILLLTGLVVGWVLLVCYTIALLVRPPRRSYAYAVSRGFAGDPSEILISGRDTRGLEYIEWTFRSRGRDLPVWDVRGLDPQGPVIIITHGFGESRVMALPRVMGLAPLASRLIVWDLPAHGEAARGGFTLGASEHQDLLALIQELTGPGRGERVTIDRLVLYGSSLGAGVSIVAAATLGASGHAPRSVIAEAPYRAPITPARNVFRLRGMPYRSNLSVALGLLGLVRGFGTTWAGATGGTFDRAAWAGKLPSSTPLLVLHGTLDEISPVADGEAIAHAASAGRMVRIADGGHHDLWIDPAHAAACQAAVRSALA